MLSFDDSRQTFVAVRPDREAELVQFSGAGRGGGGARGSSDCSSICGKNTQQIEEQETSANITASSSFLSSSHSAIELSITLLSPVISVFSFIRTFVYVHAYYILAALSTCQHQLPQSHCRMFIKQSSTRSDATTSTINATLHNYLKSFYEKVSDDSGGKIFCYYYKAPLFCSNNSSFKKEDRFSSL